MAMALVWDMRQCCANKVVIGPTNISSEERARLVLIPPHVTPAMWLSLVPGNRLERHATQFCE